MAGVNAVPGQVGEISSIELHGANVMGVVQVAHPLPGFATPLFRDSQNEIGRNSYFTAAVMEQITGS